ncbi:MAG: universal stress protein [Gammaproteobacteria bacterium]
MRVILVPMSDRPESKTALKVAAGIADSLDANLIGCHLRPHRDLSTDYKSTSLPLFGHPDQGWIKHAAKKGSASSTKRAEKAFSQITEKAGFAAVKKPRKNMRKSAIWHEMVGTPNKLMAIQGPVADLTVVSRPAAKAKVAKIFMMAALMHSGRPVLILPQDQKTLPGKRVAIAWNQSAEAMRNVSACMPVLQQAEVVTVISCGPENRPGPKSKHLQDYLKTYGVDSKILHSRGKVEEKELMSAYKDSKSDLLLMGAYSRARFREVVFGGMTHYMLSKARIPVLMLHS